MIANLLPIVAKAAPAAGALPGASLLGLDFAALLAPAAGEPAPLAPRQESADDGKDLPADGADAWLAAIAGTLAAPLPAPAAAAAPMAAAPASPTAAQSPQPAPLAIPLPTSDPQPGATTPSAAPLASAAALPVAFATTTLALPPAKTDAPALVMPAAPKTRASDDTPRVAVATVAVSAAQVVAGMAERPAPLLQGFTALARPPAATPPAETPLRTTAREQGGEVRADGTIQFPLVAAAIEPHRAMLDLRQEHWPQRMVEHIETLRDAADAADTRIRLVPDALGTVDVQLRREGETVHVAFAADRAETRALLDQAQPKLTELGEARGLRFAQSGADGGGQAPQRQPATPRVPVAPTRTIDQSPADDADATRIA